MAGPLPFTLFSQDVDLATLGAGLNDGTRSHIAAVIAEVVTTVNDQPSIGDRRTGVESGCSAFFGADHHGAGHDGDGVRHRVALR